MLEKEMPAGFGDGWRAYLEQKPLVA